MLLELMNLMVHYGRARALNAVSVHVKEGEIVTIIGLNGAGKTTILKSVAALVRPSGGEIWFDSQRIDSLAPENMSKRGISFCMEGKRLFPFMTVLENLQTGAFCRRDKAAIRHDLDNLFQQFPVLGERRKQKAGTLSGGQQQMLAIARALMSKPRLLLLDEPSLGLAPKIISDLGKSIIDLNRTGLSVLLVEQNTQLALSMAHRGYLLEVGEITLEGDAKSLQSNDHIIKAYLGI